jgi:hypothetical protein
MNDKQKAKKLLSITLSIMQLKSDLNEYPEIKMKLSRQIKALDEIDEAVEAESVRLGVDPEDI